MFCHNCGQKLDDAAIYCEKCGVKVRKEDATKFVSGSDTLNHYHELEYELEDINEEMLKTVGIARIIFQNEIAIQIPPNLIKGYEHLFIEMGINDFGGISPVTLDFINPECKWPIIENLIKICEEIDYILDERLPIYPKYIEKSRFLSKRINKIINNFS